MRRALVAAIAAPALLLSACGSNDPGPSVDDPSKPVTTSETTSDATVDETTTESTSEETTAEETTSEETTAEETTSEEATSEETTDEGGGESSEDGQAAADKTEQWLVAFVSGDEKVCDYMLDLSSEGPMKDNSTDYGICKSMIPSMAGDMFDEEMVGIIESMSIDGATVEGDEATVGKDNFSKTFAAGIGDKEIHLKKIDGEWYVDLNTSFQ